MKRSVFLLLLAALLAQGCQSSHGPAVAAPHQNTELARVQNEAASKLIQQGKFDAAEDILKNALAADVTYAPAMNNLGLVYYQKYQTGQENSLYDAAWWFEKAIRLAPHKPEIRNNLGRVLEEAGKLREATDAYSRAYEMEPDNPQFIGNLARAREKRGLRDEETRKLLMELIYK